MDRFAEYQHKAIDRLVVERPTTAIRMRA